MVPLCKLILASTSPYRAAQLRTLRIPFSAEAPLVDESIAKSISQSGIDTAKSLAYQKAAAVQSRFPSDYVLGGDQIALLNEQRLDKPGSRAANVSQLNQLSGKTHRLVTAICLLGPQNLRLEHVDETRLTMKTLTHAEIGRYVDKEKAWDCAGGYRIESLGLTLFDKIESDDFTAIQGTPLLTLCSWLRRLGFELP